QTDGAQTLVNWCDDKDRGVYGEAFSLGRVRSSKPQELGTPPFELGDYSLVSIERSYPNHLVTMEQKGMDRTLLILKYPWNPEHETHVLIDTAGHVTWSIEQSHKGKTTWTSRYGDFVQIAGTWWARKLENVDDKGRIAGCTTQTIQEVTADALTQRLQKEIAGKEHVQFIHEPLPSLANTKRALAQGKTTFDDQLVLLLHFGRSQQWTRTVEHLEQLERLTPGKLGVRWLRNAVLHAGRRHEELKKRFTDEAQALSKSSEKSTNELYLANYLLGQAGGILQANEMLAWLDTLKPMFERQPSHLHATKTWQRQRVSYLQQAGRNDEALSLHKELAVANPRDYYAQQQYAQAVVNVRDYEAAYA